MRQFSLPFSSIEAKNHKIDRGGKERIFDDMNNGFGWAMAENTVFLLLTALIRAFSIAPRSLSRRQATGVP